MKLLKHEKIVACVTAVFILAAFLLSMSQQNIINVVNHSEAKATPYLVDINTADISELDALDGIGPKLAERIVKHRLENGNFNTVYELCNVNGIGYSTFEKIKDYIKV